MDDQPPGADDAELARLTADFPAYYLTRTRL